jgi:FdrA protein
MKMVVRCLIKPAEYHDSVSLMLAARELTTFEGVEDAAVVMATQANKSILAEAGLLTEEARAASPNDLLIAVRSETTALAEAALTQADGLLMKKHLMVEGSEYTPQTIRSAITANPSLNLAIISVAGRYAAGEAWEALRSGLNVLLFSDNVSLEDEIALKKYARQHGLLLMGPGAGTAIINHIALGFANVIPSGPVGIISAAGTGLQEVSCLLARQGVGITQGIGTGGRDLNEKVGGMMMLEALNALQRDPTTQVLVLISKPPSASVVKSIHRQVSISEKPTVICFLGEDEENLIKLPNITYARTLQECALLAARAVRPDLGDLKDQLTKENALLARQAALCKQTLKTNQRYLRGLFSGGTLCYEAQVIWRDMLDDAVYSNAPLPGGLLLADSTKSQQHSAVDLGEEEFTVGRPHPMIDNDLRIRRLLQEACDPETAVILLDVVLGYGAHPDPATELAQAVRQARTLALNEGRELPLVASVTGTEDDPQDLHQSISALTQVGVMVCESNASAARLSGMIVSDRG